jgi:hypothetical protein
MRFLRMIVIWMLASPLLLNLLMPNEAQGQTQPVTGSITTATAGLGNCVSARAQNNSIVGIDVSGTWSGTLQPTVQILTTSGAPTRNKKVTPLDSTTPQSTITANGGFKATISGWTQINICASSWSSGTAVVTVYAMPGSDSTQTASGGGGGLSGMTASQVPIAATASTVTSSKSVLGTDASLISGTGTFSAADLGCGDANAGLTPCTVLPGGILGPVDSRTDTGSLSATACGRIQDLAANSTMIDARADQSATAFACGAIDFDPLTVPGGNTILFGSGNGTLGSVYTTDLGFHNGAFEILQGNGTNVVVSGSPSPPAVGTVLAPSANFPGNTFTMTGTSGNGTATLISGAATADTVLIGPGTRFILTGGTDHTIYRVTECNTNGTPCFLASHLTQSQCTSSHCYSQYYSLAPSSSITISFVPTLNSSPSTTALTLLAPILTLGDATGVNAVSQSSCGNCNTALTGSQVKNIGTGGGAANASCIGGLNIFGQENSFFQEFYVTDCAIGLIIEGPGAGGASTVHSGPYSKINVNFDALFAGKWGTTQPVVPMEIDGGAEEIDRVTLNAVNVGAAAQLSLGVLHITNAPGSNYGHGGDINIHDLHMEGCDNTVCGSSTIATGVQDGVLIDSANGGGSITGAVSILNSDTCPGAHSCLNAFHVASSFAGSLNIANVTCGTGTTNVIKDDINGNTMTCANNVNGAGYYRLDGVGTAWTNLNCADMTKGWCEYNGVWAYYSGGSATVSTTSSTATQKAAVFNATTGFQIGGAAPSNHCLLGNATNYVDSANCAPLASPTFTGATLMSNSLTLQNPGTSQTLQLSNGNCSGALCATANEYVNLSYDATNTVFFLQSYKSGTGSTRSLCFGASSSEQWCTDSSGEFKPFVDNTRTLGTTSARPSTAFTYILDMKGLLTNYNNVATAGYGQAVIRGSVVATAQVAAISTTTAYAVPATSNALFRISGNIGCSTSSAAATATLTLSWTDTSSTVQTAVPTAATCTTLGSASMTSFTQLVQAKLSTNITYAVAIASTPTYDLRFTVEQLTSN